MKNSNTIFIYRDEAVDKNHAQHLLFSLKEFGYVCQFVNSENLQNYAFFQNARLLVIPVGMRYFIPKKITRKSESKYFDIYKK